MASFRRQNITLALFGRVGNGKSACGNSILGTSVFPTSDDVESCTHRTMIKSATRKDMNITVVDTPGVIEVDAHQDLENMTFHLPEVMNVCPEGIDAFCLVLKYGAIFSGREIKAVEKLKEVFGANCLRNHGIIIMTEGDKFDLNYEDSEDFLFQQWCEKRTGELKKLINECNNRVVLFYNKGRQFEIKRERAVEQLLSFATTISREGVYISDDFEKCFKEREKEILKHKIPTLSLSARKHLDHIAEDLSRLIRLESATQEDLNRLKMSNETFLSQIVYNGNDADAKLSEIITYIHRQLVRINLQNPIKEQLGPIIKTIEELKKPSIPAKTKLVIAIAIATVGILAGVYLNIFALIKHNTFYFELPLWW